MPIDLLANAGNQQQQSSQPVDLLASSPPEQAQPSISGGAQLGEQLPQGPSTAHKIMAYALGVPQGVAEHVSAIAQLGDEGINHVFGTNLQSPHPSVFMGSARKLEKIPAAHYGKMTGGILTDLALGAPISRIAEGAPLLARMMAYGGASAATQPGGVKDRLVAGSLGAAGGAADYLGSVFKHLPSYLRDSSLAKHILKANQVQKRIANKLYDATFSRIGGRLGFIRKDAQEALIKIRDIKKGTADIEDAVSVYNKDPTISGLHKLRSSIGKKQNYLETKKALGTLSPNQEDVLVHTNKLKSALDKGLEQQLKSIDPFKHEEYLKAQRHWRNNVVPFQSFNSIKNLLKNGEIKGTLRSNVATHYVSSSLFPKGVMQQAKRIRELTGLIRSPLKSVPALKKSLSKGLRYGTLVYLLGHHFESEGGE